MTRDFVKATLSESLYTLHAVLTLGQLVFIESIAFDEGELPSSIKLVDSVDGATHEVSASYYNSDTGQWVFDFERVNDDN